MNKITKLMAASALMLMIGCQNENNTPEHLDLSLLSYTFEAVKADSVMIGVNCRNEWDFAIQGDWITAEKIGKDSLLVKSLANDSQEARNATVSISSGNLTADFQADQMGKYFSGYMFDFPISSNGCMSKGGKFAGYVDTRMENGNYVARAYVIDIEKRETKEIPLPKNTQSGTGQDFNFMQAISDDGKIIIFKDNRSSQSSVYVDGEYVELPLPDGCRYAKPEDMSGDGSVIVGYCHDREGLYQPIKWTNFECEALERPTNNAGGSGAAPGTMARGCSADGSVIFGSEWRHMGLVYWTEDGSLHNPGVDYAEITVGETMNYVSRIVKYSETFGISNDGRYIGSYYADMTAGDGSENDYPVIIDTKTGNVNILKEMTGISVTTISNDGTVFGGYPTFGMSSGCVLDTDNIKSINLSEWFKDNYGIDISSSNRFVTQVSKDSKVISGYKMINGGMGLLYPTWIISLD